MIPGFHADQFALYAENIDKSMSSGCQVPGCKHENHVQAGLTQMFLTGACHPNGGQLIQEQSDPNGKRILVVLCRVCGKFCAAVYIESFEGLFDTPHDHTPNFHVDIGYFRGEARFVVLCAHPDCRAEIANGKVMHNPNPDAPILREPLRPMKSHSRRVAIR